MNALKSAHATHLRLIRTYHLYVVLSSRHILSLKSTAPMYLLHSFKVDVHYNYVVLTHPAIQVQRAALRHPSILWTMYHMVCHKHFVTSSPLPSGYTQGSVGIHCGIRLSACVLRDIGSTSPDLSQPSRQSRSSVTLRSLAGRFPLKIDMSAPPEVAWESQFSRNFRWSIRSPPLPFCRLATIHLPAVGGLHTCLVAI